MSRLSPTRQRVRGFVSIIVGGCAHAHGVSTNSCEATPTDERIGLDGAPWLIEGRRDDTYHCVDRPCPQGAVCDL